MFSCQSRQHTCRQKSCLLGPVILGITYRRAHTVGHCLDFRLGWGHVPDNQRDNLIGKVDVGQGNFKINRVFSDQHIISICPRSGGATLEVEMISSMRKLALMSNQHICIEG